jgi:PII-like signaling protein
MALSSDAEVLRIFLSSLKKHSHRPLYEVIVEKARHRGLAGATVTKGLMGFGPSGRLHRSRLSRIAEDLPVIVEVVDKPDRIAAFLDDLDGLISDELVTVQRVHAMAHRRQGK